MYRLVPVMRLPPGYYEILSARQRAELHETIQSAYDTYRSDDTRIYWVRAEVGGIEDGWCILIPYREGLTNYSDPEEW